MVDKTIFLNVFATLFIMAIISTSSFAAKPVPVKKQKLVLMPIKVSEEDRSLSGAMETALVEGLQDKYIVFSGENVQQKARSIFNKESQNAKGQCDETRCLQDIAMAFQAELIAVANVTKRDNGYFLAINIQNIFDNKVVYTRSLAYENQNAFQIIDKLKELTGSQTVVNNMPLTTSTVIDVIKTSTDTESALWGEVQAANTEDDYNIYLDAYPKGKYVLLVKARIQKLKDTKIALQKFKEQEAWTIAQKQDTTQSYSDYMHTYSNSEYLPLAKVKLNKLKADKALKDKDEADKEAVLAAQMPKDVFIDKSTSLTWQDNEDAKIVSKDWQGAKDYCQNLILVGQSDWHLPTKEELLLLYPKKELLKNISYNYWSSTEYISNSVAWYLSFGTGYMNNYSMSKNFNVRCVRNNK